jgi:hypothetical protein
MLTPEGKIGLALVTGTLVVGIYQMEMASPLDIRSVESGNADVQSQERAATWMAAAAVAGVSLVSKSPEVFTIGGIMVVAMAWTYRHADQVSPLTKRATGLITPEAVAKSQMSEAAPATGPAQAAPVYSAVI